MRRTVNAFVLACVLGLAACVVTSHGINPQPVPNQPDTFRFRIFPAAVLMEATFADRAADEEIGKVRAGKGYASSTILTREQRDNEFVYTVQFVR